MTAGASTLLCAALAGCATALAIPGPIRAATQLTLPAARSRWRAAGWLTVAVSVALVAGLAVSVPRRWIVLGAVGLGVLVWGQATLHRLRRRRERGATAGGVLEACETLAAELASGSPSDHALARAAEPCSALIGAVDAQRWGTEVPTALRQAASQPGAEDLRLLAAAWQVAHRSGQGLAVTIDRMVLRLRAERRTSRIVDSELASARSTGRLVAALPVAAWGMGASAGASPWEFLLGGPVGFAVMGAGLALLLGGLWWIEALADRVWRR